MHNLTRSYEDYLEALFVLEKHGKNIRSVDVASYLGVSRPAVSKTINEIKTLGLLAQSRYKAITLTDEGRKVGESIFEKHTLIKKFLIHLGVDEATAEVDCCKMEHVVSDATLAAFKKVLKERKK
ncbi:MAG: MarR family transcriptional regulator [Firmicutes bacterium]|nr:MarR family transcriptional regulator [Bacillota bacterium]